MRLNRGRGRARTSLTPARDEGTGPIPSHHQHTSSASAPYADFWCSAAWEGRRTGPATWRGAQPAAVPPWRRIRPSRSARQPADTCSILRRDRQGYGGRGLWGQMAGAGIGRGRRAMGGRAHWGQMAADTRSATRPPRGSLGETEGRGSRVHDVYMTGLDPRCGPGAITRPCAPIRRGALASSLRAPPSPACPPSLSDADSPNLHVYYGSFCSSSHCCRRVARNRSPCRRGRRRPGRRRPCRSGGGQPVCQHTSRIPVRCAARAAR